ncbi:hypothetical protein QZH41_004392 [Actinostola sp. cb2023]|nr:hypothetical protein QZH41_004392 [Actinostola sp. cb2023]
MSKDAIIVADGGDFVDAIIVADGGDFVGTAAYILRPRAPLTWLDPGAFGTLGVGGGFALGAKLCRPDSEVWIMYGDGSLGYSVAEFDTFTRHKFTDYHVVAEGYGGVGFKLDECKDDEIEATLEKAQEMANDGRAVLGSQDILSEYFERLMESVAKWTHQGSGWQVQSIERLILDVAIYQPIRGSSFAPLPAWVEKKKAIVKVRNKDNECFRWAIRSALYPAKDHHARVTKYPRDDLNWEGVVFPVTLNNIGVFEEKNRIEVNVYGIREKTIVPYRIREARFEKSINLMYYENHYSWIKAINRLFYTNTKDHHKRYFCHRCLHGFTKEDLLEEHREDCRGLSKTSCRIEMPQDVNLNFTNFHKQLPVPYVIYADFEAFNEKIEPIQCQSTTKTGKHTVNSYGYIKTAVALSPYVKQ